MVKLLSLLPTDGRVLLKSWEKGGGREFQQEAPRSVRVQLHLVSQGIFFHFISIRITFSDMPYLLTRSPAVQAVESSGRCMEQMHLCLAEAHLCVVHQSRFSTLRRLQSLQCPQRWLKIWVLQKFRPVRNFLVIEDHACWSH